jgi:hypothetical protein
MLLVVVVEMLLKLWVVGVTIKELGDCDWICFEIYWLFLLQFLNLCIVLFNI